MDLREIFKSIEAEGVAPRITYHPGKDYFCVDFTTRKPVPKETVELLKNRFSEAGYPLEVHTDREDLAARKRVICTSLLFQAET
jgi:hypothetical protein